MDFFAEDPADIAVIPVMLVVSEYRSASSRLMLLSTGRSSSLKSPSANFCLVSSTIRKRASCSEKSDRFDSSEDRT